VVRRGGQAHGGAGRGEYIRARPRRGPLFGSGLLLGGDRFGRAAALAAAPGRLPCRGGGACRRAAGGGGGAGLGRLAPGRPPLATASPLLLWSSSRAMLIGSSFAAGGGATLAAGVAVWRDRLRCAAGRRPLGVPCLQPPRLRRFASSFPGSLRQRRLHRCDRCRHPAAGRGGSRPAIVLDRRELVFTRLRCGAWTRSLPVVDDLPPHPSRRFVTVRSSVTCGRPGGLSSGR